MNNVVFYGERGFIDLFKYLLANGVETPDRTGVGVIKTFNHQIIFDLGNGEFPFSTIRPAPLRLAFEEFWMFLRGQTDTKILEAKGINFWKGNTSREFLDGRGLTDEPEGSMGKAYGYQLRNFSDTHDQLTELTQTLADDPFSRRMLQTMWNPSQSKDMALTPCWHSHLFNVVPDGDGSLTLNMKVFNRSLDLLFGATFAMQQYALYMMCMAEISGMKCGQIVFDLSDVHLYNNQLTYAHELVEREFGRPGFVEINKKLETLEDVLSLQWEDIIINDLEVNTTPFKTPRPTMAV